MPTISSSQLPPPDSWEEFEQIVLDIVQQEWKDPTAIENGRTGQAQHGIDIVCTPKQFNGDRCGVQCKNTATSDADVIEDEVEKAEQFQPSLNRFIVATTWDSDARLRQQVQRLSEDRIKDGRFPVDILFWNDLIAQLTNHEKLVQKHYPQFFSNPSSPYCQVYAANEEGVENAKNDILDNGGCNSDISYVEREEPMLCSSSTKLHIDGPKGSGKSRVLAELAEDYGGREAITDIIVPERSVSQVDDLEPALENKYAGDVLLLWDDIHRIDPVFNNDVFREAVLKLDQIVSDQGHDLHVISTSRSESRNTITEYDDIESPLWTDFEVIIFDTPSEDMLNEILDASCEEYDVSLDEEQRSDLLWQIYRNDPSPLYLTSILQRWDDLPDATKRELSNLPKTTEKFWANQYNHLKDKDHPARYVLWSAAIIDSVNLPLLTSVVKGLCEEIFDRSWYELEDHIETLEQRGWAADIGGSEPEDDFSILAIHDAKIEAVTDGMEPCVEEVAEFLKSRLEDYAPVDHQEFVGYLQGEFAINLHTEFHGEFDDIAKEQFENVVGSERNNRVTTFKYALFLHCTGEHEEAKEYYETVLDEGPHPNFIHIRYADLLHELGLDEEAEKMYLHAIKFDERSIVALAHYAKFLERQGQRYDARDISLRAVDLQPRSARDHWMLAIANHHLCRYFKAYEQYKIAAQSDAQWTHNTSFTLFRSDIESKISRIEEALEEERQEVDSAVLLHDKIAMTINILYSTYYNDEEALGEAWYSRAKIHACEGEHHQAMLDLAAALRHDGQLSVLAVEESLFAELMKDGRFYELIESAVDT
jgi:tetratricopeptide (TPR) repeat protein